MARKFVCVTMMLLLCACIQHAFALGSGRPLVAGTLVEVTKETQAKLGLNFTLVAERVDAEAVLVSLEIPRTGKLKNLRSVKMRIGSGRPLVSASLQTTPGKNGSWIVSFQLSPELADKCSIDLIGPYEGLSYYIYAIAVKGYVTARK